MMSIYSKNTVSNLDFEYLLIILINADQFIPIRIKTDQNIRAKRQAYQVWNVVRHAIIGIYVNLFYKYDTICDRAYQNISI